ncbi:hypothetical protein D3C85_753890 [compost metagenome]
MSEHCRRAAQSGRFKQSECCVAYVFWGVTIGYQHVEDLNGFWREQTQPRPITFHLLLALDSTEIHKQVNEVRR